MTVSAVVKHLMKAERDLAWLWEAVNARVGKAKLLETIEMMERENKKALAAAKGEANA